MAWTDFSNTASDDWTVAVYRAANVVGFTLDLSTPPTSGFIRNNTEPGLSISALGTSFNVLGFEDGYQPASTPDPIANNIGEGGGGGSTRPSSGLLYPRGTS